MHRYDCLGTTSRPGTCKNTWSSSLTSLAVHLPIYEFIYTPPASYDHTGLSFELLQHIRRRSSNGDLHRASHDQQSALRFTSLSRSRHRQSLKRLTGSPGRYVFTRLSGAIRRNRSTFHIVQTLVHWHILNSHLYGHSGSGLPSSKQSQRLGGRLSLDMSVKVCRAALEAKGTLTPRALISVTPANSRVTSRTTGKDSPARRERRPRRSRSIRQ